MIHASWCSKSSLAKAAGAEVPVRWKMARGCRAKHIFKSKCTKLHNRGPILDVLMFKNGTRLWREAHFQVKMHKTPQSRTNFRRSDVQKWHAAVARSSFSSQNAQNTQSRTNFRRSDVQKWHAAVAWSTFARQNVQNTTLSGHFLKLRCQTN